MVAAALPLCIATERRSKKLRLLIPSFDTHKLDSCGKLLRSFVLSFVVYLLHLECMYSTSNKRAYNMVIYLGHKLCNFSSLKYSSRRSWTDVYCEFAYNNVIVNHWTYILPYEVVHLLVLRTLYISLK